MLRSVGHPVRALRRVGFAGLILAGVPEGATRSLSNDEIKDLREQVGLV